MTHLFNTMSISKRLQTNLIVAFTALLIMAVSAYSAMQFAIQQSEQLIENENALVEPISQFQRDYTQTIQTMNDTIITMNEDKANTFNQRIDQLNQSLLELLTLLGAQVAPNSDGLLEINTDSVNPTNLP